MLLRVKVPAYSWKPLLASTTHWSPTGKQWQCEFASQPSKYLNTAQSGRTVLPQSHDHQGFHWLLSPLPRCLNILLALLPPSLWPSPLLPPLFRAGKNKWEVPLFLPCLAASRSAGILLPTALCAAGEGRAPLRGGSLRRAIPGLAAEVLRKSQLHCTEDKRGPEIKVFLQVLLASPGAQALCLPNFDTPPPTRSL